MDDSPPTLALDGHPPGAAPGADDRPGRGDARALATAPVAAADLHSDAFPYGHGHQKSGYRVEWVIVNPDGSNASQELFRSGFLDGQKIPGRPPDVIAAPDGSLLVADDQAGAIDQVSYVGAK